MVHKTPRGRLNKTLPCTRNKSVTCLLSTICVDNEPIKRHLINDCSNLKKNRYVASDIGIYLPLEPTKLCAKFKGVYRLNKTHALQTTSLHVQKMGVNRYL